jgi:hypothetical protein
LFKFIKEVRILQNRCCAIGFIFSASNLRIFSYFRNSKCNIMTNEELLKLNTSLLLIGFKIDALLKSLLNEQKETYRNIIANKKEIFLSKLAKSLPKDTVDEFLLMLDVD